MSFLQGPNGAFSPAHPVASPAGSVQTGNAAQAALGNYTSNPVAAGVIEERRLQAFALKDTAAKILRNQSERLAKLAVRVSHCRRVSRSEMVRLDLVGDRAKFDGLKTCNSVWCCSICSARISARRRDELNALLAGARAEGLAVVMLTLTASHKRGMNLPAWLESFKEARRMLRRHRRWVAIKSAFVGGVCATEVTHSYRASFHPHLHEIMVFDCSEAEALAAVEGLREAWTASLGGQGLSCNENGFQVQPATAAGEYVGKFGAAGEVDIKRSKGAAAEMSSSQTKEGRKGSMTPWQLLQAASDKSDPKAARYAAVWAEFAAAFLGRRQLVWSPNLKARFGVEEISDDEISEVDPRQEVELLRVWFGASDEWRRARRRSVALLRAAETGADLDRAEYGPTDSERWRAMASGPVIEGEL